MRQPPRELEVLGLIARGHANCEIAAALFLSLVLAYECGLVRPGAG